MARFDVYQFKGAGVSLVLDVQADLLRDLATRVVVPLVPLGRVGRGLMPPLTPILQVRGRDYVMMTTDIATIPTARLGRCVTNVASAHGAVVAALDFLFQGF